ncbi:MAG: nuclear transport factor 2 family protein [Elusimicrobia bacterium]|nr:nuclear transport factor 2 family protein [Elusimicrobiota bacterium]
MKMKRIALLAAALAAATVAVAAAGSAGAKAPALAAIDAYWQAYAAKDAAKLLTMTAPDYFGYGTGKDEQVSSREQFQKSLARDFAQAKSISVKLTLLGFGHSGRVAWAAHGLEYIAQTETGEVKMEGRLTSVLVQKNGKWLLQHSHFSTPQSGQEEGRSFPAPKK